MGKLHKNLGQITKTESTANGLIITIKTSKRFYKIVKRAERKNKRVYSRLKRALSKLGYRYEEDNSL